MLLRSLFKKSGVTEKELSQATMEFPQIPPLRNLLLKRSYVVKNLTAKTQIVTGVEGSCGDGHLILEPMQELVLFLFADEVERLEGIKVAYGGEWAQVFEVKRIKRVAR